MVLTILYLFGMFFSYILAAIYYVIEEKLPMKYQVNSYDLPVVCIVCPLVWPISGFIIGLMHLKNYVNDLGK